MAGAWTQTVREGIVPLLRGFPRILGYRRANIVPVPLTVQYELAGCANGAQLALRGRGTADPASGRLRLVLGTDRVPLGWDPALALLGGLDLPLLVTAAHGADGQQNLLPRDGLPVLGRTHSEILDDQGRELGTMRSAWHAHRQGQILALKSQLLTAEIRFEVLEEVTGIAPFEGVLASTRQGGAVLTSLHAFETNRGSCYRCVSTTWAEPMPSDTEARQYGRLRVDSVGLRRGSDVVLDLVARLDPLEPPSP